MTRVKLTILLKITADFDGDALNGLLMLDHKTQRELSRLEPHLGVLDLQSPRSISGNIAIPPPPVITISNWLREGRNLAETYGYQIGEIQ